MLNHNVINEIDNVIKEIWITDIKRDYKRHNLLKEDSLKCALYYHMRRKLEKLLKENGLRIYPEYYIKEMKYRADIAIVKIDEQSEASYLEDWVEEVVAIFELKYEAGCSQGTMAVVKQDISKMKQYVKAFDCLCYFAIVYETECEWLHWMDKRATNNWAKDKVTELNAGYLDGNMEFEVNSY